MKKIGLFVLNLDKLLTEDKLKGGGGHVARRILKAWLERKDILWDVICSPVPSLSHSNINEIVRMPANQCFEIDSCIKEGNEILELKNYDEVVSLETVLPYGVSLLQSHSYPYRYKLYNNPFLIKLYSFLGRKKIEEQKKRFSSKTTKLVAMSEKIKQDYSENFDIPFEKIYVAYPGCEIKEPDFIKQKNEIFTFGIVSGSSANKGAHRFLFALKKIIKKDKKVRAFIINANANNATLVEFLIKILNLSDYVKVIEYQTNIADFYKSLDCLVMPSRHEAFGLVAIEAASYHVVPIVSNNSGFAELVNDSENGFIFDINNSGVKNLSISMKKVLDLYRSNPSQFEKVQNSVFKTAEKYSWKSFCDKVFKVVTEE